MIPDLPDDLASRPPTGLASRPPTEDDHRRVLAVMDDWWGGLGGADGSAQRRGLVPRLFFQHFSDTSAVVERAENGRLAAFLLGLRSQSAPELAYIHFVGVDPALRRHGIAAALYGWFFETAAAAGARRVRCITSPANTTSVAFHTRLGFTVEPGDAVVDGVPVTRDYDGPGLHRVTFVRDLPPQ